MIRSIVKRCNDHKKIVSVLFMVAVVACCACFAEEAQETLGKKVGILLQVIASPWVRGVACIALIAEAIGMITAGRQEPGMFKKFIPWIAGTIIFMAAGTITSKFIDQDPNFSNDVGITQ